MFSLESNLDFFEKAFEPLFYLFNPTKRIFFLYSLSSLILAIILLIPNSSLKQSLQKIFNKKIWFHRSSKIDVQFLFTNSFIRALMFIFFSFTSIAVAKWTLRTLNRSFPDNQLWSFSYSDVILLYALSSFVILDFTRFLQHYLFHKIPILWRFHKIHHSAEVLTPLTLYRTHPIESLVSNLRRTFVIGVLSGLFLFKTRSMISGYEILGVNTFDFVFNIFGSNLRHSHIWLSFGPLNYLFMSPAQHQIHHSRAQKHFDKNFGFALSIWDLAFRSFYQVKEKEFLILGVRGALYKSYWQALKAPFVSK